MKALAALLKRLPWAHWLVPVVAAALVAAWMFSVIPARPKVPVPQLDAVRATGVLRVASVYGRTTCFTGPTGIVGYECELAQGIARRLGVTAEVLFVPTPADAVQALLDGRADLAAAALTPSTSGHEQLRFSPAIDRAAPELVYRMGKPRPKTAADLAGRLLVSEGSGHAAHLPALSAAASALQAGTTTAYDAEDLLFQVASGELDYTVASSALIAINARYYPQLRSAFLVGPPEDVVFAFRGGDDATLADAAAAYLKGISGKEMARLHDRYFGHVGELDYFSAVQVANHMGSRLPRYKAAFQAAGERTGIDWRLLAAVGYQESHWDPNAVSYTGVRGLMMLTHDTAQRYKVANREDPVQSIDGGAKVLADLLAIIPDDVPEPDRTFMALAAYNQGLGHLLDARALTAQRGGNPRHWLDVRDSYPLLSRPRWASQSKYGLVRGREAVDFVANVRAYLDIITMLTSGARTLPPPPLRLEPRLQTAARETSPAEATAPSSEAALRLATDERLQSLESESARSDDEAAAAPLEPDPPPAAAPEPKTLAPVSDAIDETAGDHAAN